jgi:hypothetical protein
MASKLESLAQEFMDSVYVGGYVPGGKPKTSGARKRAADPAADKPKRAAKTEAVGDMKDIAANGKVRHITSTQKVGKASHITKCYQYIIPANFLL